MLLLLRGHHLLLLLSRELLSRRRGVLRRLRLGLRWGLGEELEDAAHGLTDALKLLIDFGDVGGGFGA